MTGSDWQKNIEFSSCAKRNRKATIRKCLISMMTVMTALHTLSVIPVVEQPTACNGKMLELTQIFRSMRKFVFTRVERTESRLRKRLQWSTWGKFIYLPQAAVLPICAGMDVRTALLSLKFFRQSVMLSGSIRFPSSRVKT